MAKLYVFFFPVGTKVVHVGGEVSSEYVTQRQLFVVGEHVNLILKRWYKLLCGVMDVNFSSLSSEASSHSCRLRNSRH